MFLKLITARRSIRKYQSRKIEEEKIEILKECLLRSPSSRNLNPWQFIFITDQNLLVKLAQLKPHGAEFLAGAFLAVAVLGDPQRCDVWIEDCSIASLYLLLSAQDIGLGACWVQVRERKYNQSKSSEEYVREVLNIPQNIKVESLVALGYPAEEIPPLKKEELNTGKIFINQYKAF